MASNGDRSKPHALAVPLPFQGHIQPLMELSKKLVSAGFMVTFANTQANHKRMQGILNQRKPADKRSREEDDGDLHLVSLDDGLPEEFDSFNDLLAEVFKPAMRAAVAHLLARLSEKGPPVSLLAFDFRLLYVLDLALEAGIPSLAFWTQNAASFVCNLLVAQGLQLPPDDSMLIASVKGVPPFPLSEISGLALQHYLPPSLINEYAWEPFKRISEPTWVVINTFKELETTTLDDLKANLGSKLLALGPLVNGTSFSIAKGVIEVDGVESHLKWLHGHPQASVLYISFGSIATLSEEQLEELILGLEASEVRFLWVFRPDLCQKSKKYTIESLSRRFEDQGLMVRWTSQWHILSHDAIGGFLTHCGWNSTLEGITTGVPMLGWPTIVDQPLTGRCIEEQWGVGLRLKVDNKLVSRNEVHKKVIELMQGVKGVEVREKAIALSRAAKRALDDGGSSWHDFAILHKAM